MSTSTQTRTPEATRAETGTAPFTIEPVGGPFPTAFYGVCATCGDRTKRKGSQRHATNAIRDHVNDMHPEALGS